MTSDNHRQAEKKNDNIRRKSIEQSSIRPDVFFELRSFSWLRS